MRIQKIWENNSSVRFTTLVLYSLFLELLRGILEYHKGSPTGKGTAKRTRLSDLAGVRLAARLGESIDLARRSWCHVAMGYQYRKGNAVGSLARDLRAHILYGVWSVFYNSKALVLNRAQVQFRYFPTGMDDVSLMCVLRNPWIFMNQLLNVTLTLVEQFVKNILILDLSIKLLWATCVIWYVKKKRNDWTLNNTKMLRSMIHET